MPDDPALGEFRKTFAGALGWTMVQTHHVGIKPALVRPDRPSREPELDAPDVPAVREVPGHLAIDDLAARRARRTAVTAPLQRFRDDYLA